MAIASIGDVLELSDVRILAWADYRDVDISHRENGQVTCENSWRHVCLELISMKKEQAVSGLESMMPESGLIRDRCLRIDRGFPYTQERNALW